MDIWLNLSSTVRQIIIAVAVLLVTFVAAQITRAILHRNFLRSSKDLKVDPTHYSFLKHFIVGLVYLFGIIAMIYTVPSLRTLSVSLLAGAGVLAVAVGFASQQAFANIISGIFIVIFKPFRVGDRIDITDKFGIVEDITLRHTVIRDFKNKRIIIPNSVVSEEQIINSNIADEHICEWIEFGISYDSDVDLAKKIMIEEAEKHELSLDHRTQLEKRKGFPRTQVQLVGFGDSSVNLRAWVWTRGPADAWQMKCDLNESIKKRFDAEGIEIPFPYRTIVMKNGNN